MKEKIAISKELKAIGAVDAEQEDGKISLSIDPSQLSPKRRRRMAEGLSKAIAAEAYNAPFFPDFFEGQGNINEMREHDKMRLAMLYFQIDPMVGKIIEVMTSLAVQGFKNEDTDKKRKEFYDQWCEAVDFEQVLRWIFLEWFRSGNVTVARALVPANSVEFIKDVPEYSTRSSEEMTPFEQAIAAKKYTYSKQSIPGAYTILNPLTVFVPNTSTLNEMLIVKGDESSLPSLTQLGTFLTEDKIAELKLRIKEFKGIPLHKKNVSRILRMQQPYEKYGHVMMSRAFNALYEKNKLRQADLSMLNSSLNRIIKVTIGNDQYPATQAQLLKLTKAFINTGKSQTIFWNHTLDIKILEPVWEPFKKSRYERVDEDIRNAFGISEILTGSVSAKANFATGFISLKVFITNMKDARADVKRWIRSQYKDIAQAMGFDGYPEPSFSELALTDEIGEKQILMQLVDRGIISYETAQSTIGYDPVIEVNRRKRELPLMQKGVLGFGGSPYNTPQGQQGPAEQQADKEAVDTKEESIEDIKNTDTKTVDEADKKRQQIDNQYSATVKTGKRVSSKGAPKPPKGGDEGRPKTPRGKSMPHRKSAKAEGSEDPEA